MPYKSEKLFSNALCKMLKQHCAIVQRIESGTTGRGIPDIYTRRPERELWIEVKNDPRQHSYQEWFNVHWRPGQQGWMHTYWTETHKACVTIQALADGFIVIPMRKWHKNGLVHCSDCWVMTEFSDIWPVLRPIITGEVGYEN